MTFKKIRMIANLVKRQTQVRFLATVEQLEQAVRHMRELMDEARG